MEEAKLSAPGYKVFGRRWLMLILLIPIIVSSEICWLSFAPVASFSQNFFHSSALDIDLFSMTYMIMYILLSMPASWMIEKYGYKKSVVTGALLSAVFAAARFVFADSYTLVLVSQFFLAAAQPFIVNISTKVPANWFPVNERATASGLLVMAQYIGFIIPMVLSPIMVWTVGMKGMLAVYAGIVILSAALVFFAKEKPPVPPAIEAPKESMGFKNMGKLFVNKNFLPVLVLSFISMGLFNTLMTMIEKIFLPKGITSGDAGMIGAVFVLSGIIGAVILPLLSDKSRRRVPYFLAGISFIALLTAGLAFLNIYILLIAAAALLGFIIMGLAPILFQHGAEVAYPIQEGASFGTIMLMGQISGILFVALFDLLLGATLSITWPMLLLIVFAAVQIPIAARMKESPLFLKGKNL